MKLIFKTLVESNFAFTSYTWLCVFQCSIGTVLFIKNTQWPGEETFEHCWRAVLGYKGDLFFLILTVACSYLHRCCKNAEISELIKMDQHWGRACNHISSYTLCFTIYKLNPTNSVYLIIMVDQWQALHIHVAILDDFIHRQLSVWPSNSHFWSTPLHNNANVLATYN